MASLTERMARDERLDKEWQLLANQRAALEGLSLAEGCCYGDDTWCEAAMALRRKLAYELYLTVARIWDESAKVGNQGKGV